MKRLLLILAVVVLFPITSIAAPFLVCDPQTGVDYYTVDTDGVVVTGVVFQNGWIQNNKLFLTDPGGTRTPIHVLMDESILVTGAHTQKAMACKAANPPWSAEVCSTAYSVPLAFTKPAPVVAPNAPASLRLVTP